MTPPNILSIAGTDPTGGAGVNADSKAISAAGGYAMAVVTALVAQNTQGVRAVHAPPLSFLQEQLLAVSDDVRIDAIKIGMVGSAEVVASIISWLESLSSAPPVVLDPVMVTTSGDRLLKVEAEETVCRLAAHPAVSIVTPNLPELAVLCRTPQRDDLAVAIEDAEEWARANNTAVLVKGGHLSGARRDNAVVYPDGEVHLIPNERVLTSHTHGTGCSLSSALATRLGMGFSLNNAAQWATEWVHGSLAHADRINVGRGHGPIHHFHRWY